MYRILIAALMALMVAPPAAHTQDAEDARTFVLYYYDLVDSGDLEKVAALYHPDELEDYRDITAQAIAQDTTGDLAFFLGVRNAAGFLALSPAEGLARMLDLVLEEPGLHDALRSVEVIVGDVVPDELDSDVVHVKYRQKGEIQGESFDLEGTMTLRAFRGQWRAMFTPDVRGMLDAWIEPAVQVRPSEIGKGSGTCT